MLKARTRWRQLRAYGCQLEKTIWLYRARVSTFRVGHGEASLNAPEVKFREALDQWRQSLLSSASLADTEFERKHKERIYKDLFAEGDESPKYFVPADPRLYIKYRIKEMQDFYTERIPNSVWWNGFWKVLLIVSNLSCSIFAYAQMSSWVALLAMFAACCTSWSEFRGHTAKTQRYTQVAQGLRNLRTWWKSLTAIEQASVDNIEYLVMKTEDLLMTEMSSWISSFKGEKGKAKPQTSNDLKGRLDKASTKEIPVEAEG